MMVLLLVIMTACAGTSGTVEIPPEELPFPVARQPSAAGSPAQSQTFTVYLVRGNRLFAVPRRIQADLPVAEAAMRALLDGPTAAERAEGIGSLLPPDVSVLGVSVSEALARVDLSGEFQAPAPPELVALRVAQVVWTLTEITPVTEVAFAIDGEAVAVATEGGNAVERPLRRTDYASLTPQG